MEEHTLQWNPAVISNLKENITTRNSGGEFLVIDSEWLNRELVVETARPSPQVALQVDATISCFASKHLEEPVQTG